MLGQLFKKTERYVNSIPSNSESLKRLWFETVNSNVSGNERFVESYGSFKGSCIRSTNFRGHQNGHGKAVHEN